MKQLQSPNYLKRICTCRQSYACQTSPVFCRYLFLSSLIFFTSLSGCKKDDSAPPLKEKEYVLQWSNAYGGTKTDMFSAITATWDGAYMIVGTAASSDGDLSGNRGKNDVWLLKIDRSGTKIWQRNFGGSEDDGGWSIIRTADNGYLVAGNSRSNNGDVSGNHGGQDVWLLKLDLQGNIQWQKSLGGSGDEEIVFSSLLATQDGGYIMAANTTSNDGGIVGNHGAQDCWLVKLDGSGNIQWQKALGGSGFEVAVSITAAHGGGYLLTGLTNSNNGDVSGNHGKFDAWLVKVNESGNIIWQKTYGGSNDEFAYAVKQTPDGGYVMNAQTLSNDGDAKGLKGDADAWILKLNANGGIEWQKTLGSSKYEGNYCVTVTADEGYLVGAFTNGNDGDVSGNKGSYDAWLVKLNKTGDITWSKTFGGTGADNPTQVLPNPDGGYIFGGQTSSSDGDVRGQHGELDVWLFTVKSQ